MHDPGHAAPLEQQLEAERQRAEALGGALQQLERTLASIIETASEGIVLANHAGQIILWNRAAQLIFGYAEQEILGQPLALLLPESQHAQQQRLLEAAANAAQRRAAGRTVELVGRRSDGGEFPLELSINGWVSGDEIFFCGMIRDISKRRRAEEALRESEQRYRTLAEGSAVGFWHIKIEGQTIYMNQAMRSMLELAPEETLEDRTYHAFFTSASLATVDGQLPKRHMGLSSTYEAEIVGKHGHHTRVLVSGAPLFGKSGRLESLIGTFVDITERVRAEEERDRFFTLSIDILCIADLQGYLRRVNSAFERTLGIQQQEVRSRRLVDFVHPADEATTAMEIAKLELGTPSISFENRCRCSDGSYKWLAWTFVSDPATGLIYGVARDMTERRRAEEQRLTLERNLQETQKLESLGLLAGGIAHDFNNLLVAVMGNADLALLDLPTDSPARATLQQIHLAARRAADLTQQMLAYAGKGRFVVERISLNGLIEETAALLQTAVARRATLTLRLQPNLPAIEADATQLRQVVMNLIMNASEAIGEQKGTITLSTGLIWAGRAYLAETYLGAGLSEGEYVSLEVVDSGEGMDAETQSKIFQPFFTTKFTGRGLGLAAVLGIVRRHKGTLKVHSRVGRGTSFTILFPRCDIPVPTTPREPSISLPGQGHILIVDDEEHVRDVTSRMLERFGYEVLRAASGSEAVALVRQRPGAIDCVLLDMTMPELSSEETFRQIRASDPRVRIVLMSGYSEQEVASRFELAELAGFLHKPFSARDLQQRVLDAIGGAGRPGTKPA